MPFSSPAARAAFFEKLKLKQGSINPSQPNFSTKMQHSTLEANITPKMPDISKIKLPKVSDNDIKPLRFKKIKSFIKGY